MKVGQMKVSLNTYKFYSKEKITLQTDSLQNISQQHKINYQCHVNISNRFAWGPCVSGYHILPVKQQHTKSATNTTMKSQHIFHSLYLYEHWVTVERYWPSV